VTLLPRSLAWRTAVLLLAGLMLVQGIGLTIHALDRVELQALVQSREIAGRIFGIWRNLVTLPPDRRAMVIAELEPPPGVSASYDMQPAVQPGMPPVPPEIAHRFRLAAPPPSVGPARFRPREVLSAGLPPNGFILSLRLPDGAWLNLRVQPPPLRPWHSETFLWAFFAMSLCAAALILWGVRRMTQPITQLAAAAEALGRDVNAPPLPETGPTETARAAHAFNTMASRIRRFVDDRTQMVAAMSHDLRTPITRLRLRAEFMEDDEQRRKMLADLAEMEAMIDATLAFARDETAREPSVAFDLAALCQTVLDEASDAAPEQAERIAYSGPERLHAQGRPAALKRALSNLVGNALAYGGAARLSLFADGMTARLAVEDDGPGIPAAQLEQVFLPFRRLEGSRNRETGGTGLGLTIARNILRAHGGDVVLRNRPEGGLKAEAMLPLAA
jgi:signal transduction histidine kinase